MSSYAYPPPGGVLLEIFQLSINRMSLCIWIAYYDDRSYAIAKESFGDYSWARFLKLPTENNPWFESHAILSGALLDTSADYIGYLGYKAFNKIDKDGFLSLVNALPDIDYISLLCASPDFRYASAHPHFKELWAQLITPTLWITGHEVACNYWIMKRHALTAYVKWFQQMASELVKHPYAMADAKYYGSLMPDHLMKLCGVPHYPHIPFLCERLSHTFCINNGFTTTCMRCRVSNVKQPFYTSVTNKYKRSFSKVVRYM